MPWKLAVRTAALKVLAWILVFYCAFLAFYLYSPEDSDYAVSLTAETARSAYLVFVFGTAAAIRTNTLRAGGVLARGGVRSPVTIVLDALWPLLVFAVVVQVAIVVIGAGLAGTGVTLAILLVGLVVLLAQILVAGWIGLVVPGGPASLVVVVYWAVWLLVPRLAPIALLNQLNGQFHGCCGGDETWSRSAAWASLAVAVALVVGVVAALLLHADRGWSVTAAVGVPVVVAALTALLLPDASRWAASERRADDTRCFDGDVRICLRPEHTDDVERVRAAVADLGDRWRPFGVPVPATISEAGGPGRVRFQYGPDHTRDLVLFTIAVNTVPTPVGCYREPLPPRHDRELVAAVDHVTAWLVGISGLYRWSLDSALVDAVNDEANLAEVDRVSRLPDAEQAAWYQRELAVIDSCGGRDV